MLLEYLRTFQRKHHYMPSIKEMAEETCLPRTAVVWHLEKLRESNAVEYEDGKLARSLRLT
jgi:predicted ArsR family transcriptional regulator